MMRRQAAELAGVLTFFVVLFCADWLGYAVSLALFRLDPSAVPDGFHVVLAAPRSGAPGARYIPVALAALAGTQAAHDVRSFRLPEASGLIPGPKTKFAFTVVEDDGARQLVDVSSTGLLSARSRYEAYDDRLVPVAYKSFAWEYERRRSATASALAFIAAFAAAIAAGYGVRRLVVTPRADVDRTTR